MQEYYRDCMQALQMPSQYYPMTVSPQQPLQTMYPATYNIIMPAVVNICNCMTGAYGPMFTPTKEQLESMIDDVYDRVESDVDAAVRDNGAERQFFGGGRRLLKDFIGVLLLGSLLGSNPFFYGYPGFYGGFFY